MARVSSRRSPRRSQFEWFLRAGLLAVVLALGYISVIQSFAFVISGGSKERAYALWPHDGRIAAKLAASLSLRELGNGERARADRIARQALADEPLAVPALTALAINAQLRGDATGARRLIVHSNGISRRDLGTRLWLIEDAVQRNDIAGALGHYDIALRTARRAPEILFPVLTNAISNPEIATALAKTLAKRPPWGDAFVVHLAGAASDPRAAVRLFRLMADRRIVIPEAASASVIDSLVNAKAFTEAWRYYETLRAGSDRRRSRDPDFRAQIEIPTVFDWKPIVSAGGVAASIQAAGDNGIFDFATPATVGGAVLEQMQLLPPGRYRLAGRSIGIEQSEGTRPYWSLACMDGRELGRVVIPNSSQHNGRFTGVLNVDGKCPAQMLRLMVRSSSAISGVSGQIDQAALTPV